MNHMKGQSLIELLIAMAIFVLVVSAITFLILDSYIAHRAGREHTLATFLAEEGLEAARSIRDEDWVDLTDGSHGITVSGDSWIFQGIEEDISDQLNEGIRKVIVSSVDADRKEVQSKITWEFSELRSQEITLVSYLTNWQKDGPYGRCLGAATPCGNFGDPTSCENQGGCSWVGGQCVGTPTPCPEFVIEGECLAQDGCWWETF